MQGKKGEFALLASTDTVHIRVYGYDGWRYREMNSYVILKGVVGTVASMSYNPVSEVMAPELGKLRL